MFAVVLAILLVGLSNASAQPSSCPAQTGGRIQGMVYGYTANNELRTLANATVTASNQQFHFTTSTGGGGQYGTYVPGGVYNVSVYVQGYMPQSFSVAVSDGTISNVNFVLERSNTLVSTTTSASTTTQLTTTASTTQPLPSTLSRQHSWRQPL